MVQQSVAVETAVKAEEDGRGGRQTKELMRDTGFVPRHSSFRPKTEDLHVLPLGLLGDMMYRSDSKCVAESSICQMTEQTFFFFFLSVSVWNLETKTK